MTSVDEHKFEFDSISRHSNMGDGHGQAIVSSIPYDRKFAQYGMLQQPFALTSPLQVYTRKYENLECQVKSCYLKFTS